MIKMETRKRTITDKYISYCNSLRYRMTEPALLRMLRWLYEDDYSQTDESPLISIIIATYNRGRILVERTLPSILGQTYRNFEIIVVGDHCIDDTPDLLSQIKDPRLRFYDMPKRGRYPDNVKLRWFVQGTPPRNKGMQLARGKWLCWLSDDDIFTPNHIKVLLTFAMKGRHEFVSADYEEEREGHKRILGSKEMQESIGIAAGGMPTWLYRSYLRHFRWNSQCWRKDWNCPVDYDLLIRMDRAGVRMGYLDEVVTIVPPVEGTNTVGLRALLQLET